MADDVILNKLAVIRRCVARIEEEYNERHGRISQHRST